MYNQYYVKHENFVYDPCTLREAILKARSLQDCFENDSVSIWDEFFEFCTGAEAHSIEVYTLTINLGFGKFFKETFDLAECRGLVTLIKNEYPEAEVVVEDTMGHRLNI